VTLPSPLVGFVREHAGQHVLAVFNLSDQAVSLDAFHGETGCSMAGSGFEAGLGSDGCLGPFGVYFGSLAIAGVSASMADA
jgi:hypothetical protein